MAGGAGMILTPSTIMPMVSLGFLSPDGKCYAFDSRANGYGRGEGVGIVVLKRLSDAIRDNDTIRGVIRGTATNQDGRTSGITLPSSEAQVVNIRKAYRDAGLDFSKTMFVECHGTGTQAGDPRELKAISDSFCNERETDNPIMVGSAKTNIGHLEGSAGVAGVIKAVMTIENGKIPKHLNFESWNPSIDHKTLKVDVARENTEWPVDGLRRISVNSFGFGGSNAHAIIDDAAHYLGEELQVVANHNTKVCPQDAVFVDRATIEEEHEQPPQLFVISAYDQGGVARIIDSYQPYLLEHASEPSIMRDYAYTLFNRRSKLQYKSYVVARSHQELTTELERVKKTTPLRSNTGKGLNVAFVFCGQGAQFAGMGKELLVFKPFRSSLEACGAYLQTLDAKFDLLGTLQQTGAEATKAVSKPSFAQPATTAVQIALVDLLTASGVKATAVVGHSSGEIAAAYAAGLVTKEDALSIAYYRGKVASQVKLKGSMLAAALSAEAAQKYVDGVKKGSVCVACINSPESVTLSGDADQMLLVQKALDQDKVSNKLLLVETAYHSHHMQTVSEEYAKLLATAVSKSTNLEGPAMFSSVLGQHVSAEEVGPDYWVKNMVSPVQFEKAVSTMVKETKALRPDVFLEISPHSVFRQALSEIVAAAGDKKADVPYFPTMVRKQDASITALAALGELWARGLSFKLDWLHKGPSIRKPKCLVDLPTYPWNHSQTYWHESHLSKAHRFRKFGAHDFLGAMSPDSVSPQEPRWRGFIDMAEQPWIEHHQIQKMIMYPAAGMVVMAVEAAKQVVDNAIDSPSDIESFEVSNFKIEEPMVIPEGQTRLEYNFNATRVEETTSHRQTTWKYTFTIYSIVDSMTAQPQHTINARGTFAVRFKPKGLSKDIAMAPLPAEISQIFNTTNKVKRSRRFEAASSENFKSGGMVPREFYERLNIIGLTYGRLFRNLAAMTDAKPVPGSESTKYCYSKVKIPNTKACMPEEYETPSTIHPATLDAMFQSLFVLGDEPMVPHFIESIRISAKAPQGAGTEFFGYSEARKRGTREAVSDIFMWHGEKRDPVVSIRGLSVISMVMPGKAIPDFLPHHRNLCSQVVWKEYITSATDGSIKGTILPDFEGLLDMMGHKTPTMRILQIGGEAKTVTFALRVLGDVPARLGRYTICDETDDIFNIAEYDAPKELRPLLEYAKLDDAKNLLGALNNQQFDLVIASHRRAIDRNVLLQTVKPAGILAWTHEDTGLSGYVDAAQVSGSDTGSQETDEDATPWKPKQWIYRSQSDPSKLSIESVVVLVPETTNPDSQGKQLEIALAKALFLDANGLTAEVMTLSTFLEQADTDNFNPFVISLLEADNALVYDINSLDYVQVHSLLEKNTNGLLWVTRGAQMSTTQPKASPFLGWARTVRSEEPDKTIVCLDLDTDADDVQDSARVICNVFFRSFAPTDSTAVKDTEFAEKGGRIFVPRLEPLREINEIVENGYDSAHVVEEKACGRALTLIRGADGVDDAQFRVDVEADRDPGPNEVVIEVDGCHILPEDAEALSGTTTETGFGTDVWGRVSRCGSEATRFRQGDKVVAIARGAVRTRIVVDERFIQKDETKEEQHGYRRCPGPYYSPTCLVTARHCLRDVQRGDNILIHGYFSAHGQAAIRVAEEKGAKINIVVSCYDAFYNNYRTFWEGPGLTRSVLKSTKGKGMDFIYNPTPHDRDSDFEMVRQHGQVILLVSPYSSRQAALPAGKSVDLKLFDFASFLKTYPDRVARLLEDGKHLLTCEGSAGSFNKSFSQVNVAFKGFKYSEDRPAQTYTLTRKDDEVLPIGRTARDVHPPASLDGDATYLVAGGLGGLGLDVLKWLANHGAKHLTILSRSGASNHGQAVEPLAALRERGVEVVVKTVDICDEQACSDAVKEIETERPVRGIIQAAAVIKVRPPPLSPVNPN